MKEEPYKNREIEEMFNDVKDTLGRIEAQTTKTNGRVSKLERWQSYVIGFCACVALLIIPLILAMAKLFIH